jgi:hypothetical protein
MVGDVVCPIENQVCFESARKLFAVCTDCPLKEEAER